VLIVLMAAAAVLLVVMAGVQIARGFNDGYPFQVDANWVRSRPDASLFYPGSQALAQSAQGEQDHPLAMSQASIPAAASSVLATDASSSQILDWYRAQLRAQGWDETTDPARTGRPHADFARGTREFIQVDVFGKPPDGIHYTGSGTVYSITYGINARY
jgi:hypothetical protein